MAVAQPNLNIVQKTTEKTQVEINVPAEAPSNVVPPTIAVETVTATQQTVQATDDDEV